MCIRDRSQLQRTAHPLTPLTPAHAISNNKQWPNKAKLHLLPKHWTWSWALKVGWCPATVTTDFGLGECQCSNAFEGQNSKVTGNFHLVLILKNHIGQFCPEILDCLYEHRNRSCPNFLGFISQHELAEQLRILSSWPKFLRLWKREQKKTKQSCAVETWTRDYYIVLWTCILSLQEILQQ